LESIRRAPPADLAPTLAVGTTVNHGFSVLVSLVVGLLWPRYGYRDIFIGGAAAAAVTLGCTLW
jgi:hypothetical protein